MAQRSAGVRSKLHPYPYSQIDVWNLIHSLIRYCRIKMHFVCFSQWHDVLLVTEWQDEYKTATNCDVVSMGKDVEAYMKVFDASTRRVRYEIEHL